MKKIILTCMLAISMVASAQFYSPTTFELSKNLLKEINLELMIQNLPDSYAGDEEQIEFEFDVNEYLPKNFDAYAGLIIDESHLLIDEEITFDFNIDAYLPKGFDCYKGMIIEEIIKEEEIPFSFTITDYLPIGFDPTKTDCKDQF